MADNTEVVWTLIALALLFSAGILLVKVRESAEESKMHLIQNAEIVIYDSTTDEEIFSYRGTIVPRETEIIRIQDLSGPVMGVVYEYDFSARLQVSVFVDFSDNGESTEIFDALN